MTAEIPEALPSAPSEQAPVSKKRGRVLWKWSLGATAALALFVLWQCASGLKTASAQSDAAVAAFHQRLDGEQYQQIVSEADAAFRGSEKQQDLIDFLAAVHSKLGLTQKSTMKFINVQVTPAGKFANVTYETSFAQGSATETFTWRMESGQLRLMGYNVNSRQLIK